MLWSGGARGASTTSASSTWEIRVQDELFVFRVGPLDMGGKPMYWYVTRPNTGQAVFHEDDAAALAEIADRFPDRALACEPALSPAGQAHGYRARPLTPFEAGARATLWAGVEFEECYESLDPVAKECILVYASRLWAHLPADELVIELEVSERGEAVRTSHRSQPAEARGACAARPSGPPTWCPPDHR
jgi:hypothetical protein